MADVVDVEDLYSNQLLACVSGPVSVVILTKDMSTYLLITWRSSDKGQRLDNLNFKITHYPSAAVCDHLMAQLLPVKMMIIEF